MEKTVYALDSTTIDHCLSLCPWAPFKGWCGAIKLYTRLDLLGSIPSFVRITRGRVSDITAMDEMLFRPARFVARIAPTSVSSACAGFLKLAHFS